ncbi:putative capsid protein [Avon-Heathcote Estuary associated circular virus 21]|uniref:putative capsid protein n=1 Tax=Avon-Heathcote Estuary associated circular virus 21 TaxID=1618245 RepID=UPI0005CD454F|nr:putative capsid protein [Avon-Heathcote Estuary associated circular virus 21]AJP36451.1 putative capsid protein [Avon-Heathcote Estuary associated circular virus 21]
MPKRGRSRTRKKRPWQRRSSSGSRRRYPLRSRRRPLALKQHAFCERAENEQTIVINTEAAATGLFETFTLSKMRQQASYAQIFEFYRIDKVVATFRYKNVNNATETTGRAQNEVNPLLYFKVDHNDNTSDSLSTMKDSMKTKTHMFTNNNPEFSIQLKPAIQSEMYRTTLTAAYTPKWGQWIPCDDPTVPHYGMKAYCCAFKNADWNPGSLQVSFKYYVSFKNNE